MDRKTLEYMEERAQKARSLVDRISLLTHQAERLVNARYINIDNGSRQLVASFEHRSTAPGNERLFPLVVSTVQGMLADEIALLEQELAEL